MCIEKSGFSAERQDSLGKTTKGRLERRVSQDSKHTKNCHCHDHCVCDELHQEAPSLIKANVPLTEKQTLRSTMTAF